MAETMGHTPGPWHTFDGAPEKIEVLCNGKLEPVHRPSNGIRVAEVRAKRIGRGGKFHRTHVDAANARLIAAAPDLLDALEDTIRRNEIQHWFNLDKARAAVAKATGQANLGDDRR